MKKELYWKLIKVYLYLTNSLPKFLQIFIVEELIEQYIKEEPFTFYPLAGHPVTMKYGLCYSFKRLMRKYKLSTHYCMWDLVPCICRDRAVYWSGASPCNAYWWDQSSANIRVSFLNECINFLKS